MNIRYKVINGIVRVIVLAALCFGVAAGTKYLAVSIYLQGHQNGCIDTLKYAAAYFKFELRPKQAEMFCKIQAGAEDWKIE